MPAFMQLPPHQCQHWEEWDFEAGMTSLTSMPLHTIQLWSLSCSCEWELGGGSFSGCNKQHG